MPCLYCGGPVPPSRGLTEAEFCSSDHRLVYESASRLGSSDYVFPGSQPALATITVTRPAPEPLPPTPQVEVVRLAEPVRGPLLALDRAKEPHRLPGVGSFHPAEFDRERGPMFSSEHPSEAPKLPRLRLESRTFVLAKPKRAIWVRFPRLPKRVVWLAVPLVLIAAFRFLGPAAEPKAAQPVAKNQPITHTSSPTALARSWADFKENLRKRAAINLSDDFRSGLADWRERSGGTASWSYDSAGFVHPGALALYRPTLALTDYRLEFMGDVSQKALGFVFRATGSENYYAVKIQVAQPGPIPLIQVVRYAVIDGREGPHIVKPLPVSARGDLPYRVLLEVRGSDFSLFIERKVADYWSDSRLASGGVGFFCGKGERARLRWVEVSHQYDTLGRLCAYLAPYGQIK